MKILQLCYKIPYPLHDGGEHSLYHSALGLALQTDVEFKTLAMRTPKNTLGEETIPTEFLALTQFESVAVDTRIKPWNALQNLFKTESYFVERFFSETYLQRLIELLQANEYHTVLLEHAYLCIYLPYIRQYSRARVVLRAQNIEYLLWESYLAHEKNPFRKAYLQTATRRLASFEKKHWGLVDGIIALTPEDLSEIKKHAPQIPGVSIPIGIDMQQFAEDMKNSPQMPVVYHLGSMDWMPNQQGIDWFLKEVWPLVAQKQPNLRLHLAGKNMPAGFLRYQSQTVSIEGRVPDAQTFLHDKTILVVPLLSGSGIRVKIVEALASGKIVVSTSIGASGIPKEENGPIFIADDATSFAQCILQAAESGPKIAEYARKARQLAHAHYDIQILAKRTVAFFNQLPPTSTS